MESFNRTTVECKYINGGRSSIGRAAFNRTTVECKYFGYVLRRVMVDTFNRTTVECKCGYTRNPYTSLKDF